MASTLVTVAARLDPDLLSRVDREVEAGRVLTRTQAIAEALVAWVAATEDSRWAEIVDDGAEVGLSPTWDDDDTDWAALYAAR